MNQPPPDDTPANHAPQLETAIYLFEEAWSDGTAPDLAEFLSDDSHQDLQCTILNELVKLDLEYRWRQGSSTTSNDTADGRNQPHASTVDLDSLSLSECWLLEQYLQHYPQLGSSHDLPLPLILEEYRVRQRWGDRPAHQNYLQRFAQHKNVLSEALSQVDEELATETSLAGSEVGATIAPNNSQTRMLGSLEDFGDSFGDYKLLEEIGRGGMGVVYRARQKSLNREVAIKMILSGGLADEEAIERFYGEAQAVAQLRHSNIVMVHEVGEQDGHHFFSMDYIQGQSLSELIRSHPLTAREAADYVRTIAAAMQSAHEAGVLHRDLKPSNILVAADGQPLITDFGLAKRTDDDSGMTKTGNVVGTPSYMPPEQVGMGDPQEVGPASDVYSLGAVLYELLTGRPPFRAESMMETLMQVLNQEPVSPRLLSPQLDRDLETITLKCLEKDPNRRYADAAKLVADLERWLAGEPIQARRITWMERSWRWCKRKPAMAGMVSVSMVAAVVLVVGGLWYQGKLRQEKLFANQQWQLAKNRLIEANEAREEAEEAKKHALENADEANEARANAEANHKRASELLYISDLRRAQTEWEDGNPDRVLSLLARHRSEEQLKDFEWYYWLSRCAAGATALKGHRQIVNSVNYSVDGKWVISGSYDGTIKIWNVKSKKMIHDLKGHKSAVMDACFHPNNQQVASVSQDGTIRIWNLMEGTHRIVGESKPPGNMCVTFSPDGKQLAWGGFDSRIVVANTADPTSPTVLRGHQGFVTDLAYTPDGQHILSSSYDSELKLWNIKTSQEVATLTGHTAAVNSLSISQDGDWAASCSQDKTVRVWDLQTKTELKVFKGHKSNVMGVSFNPEKTQLVSGGLDKQIKIWNLLEDGPPLKLQGIQGGVSCVRFSPSGRMIASGDGVQGLRLWNLQEINNPLILDDNPSPVTAIAFHPTRDQIASGSEDKYLRLYNTTSGACLKMYPGADSEISELVFINAGQHLLAQTNKGSLYIWEVETAQLLKSYQAATGTLLSGFLDRESKQFVLQKTDHTIQIRHPLKEESTVEFPGVKETLAHAFLSNNGKFLVTYNTENNLRLWSIETGKQLMHLPNKHRVMTYQAVFSPDSSLLAVDDYRTIVLWSTKTGQQSGSLSGHRLPIAGLAFGPDGKLLLSENYTGQIKVWDLTTRKERLSFVGPRGNGAHFSPTGARIFRWHPEDSTLRFWQTNTGEDVLILRGHQDLVTAVRFTADNRRIATASRDKTIRIWGRPMGADAFDFQGRLGQPAGYLPPKK